MGTYDDFSSFASASSNYYELVFTGKKIDSKGNEIAGAAPLTAYILYDFATLAAWSDEDYDAQWYGTIASINFDRDATVITVYDDFGYKQYEISVDVYGYTTYVAFSYTLNVLGKATYTALEEGDVYEFIAVTDASTGNVSYCIAADEAGNTLFSVRPDEFDATKYYKVYDGGMKVETISASTVVVDTTLLDKLD